MTLHNLTLANLNLSDLNAVLDYIQQRNISDWGGSITAASYGSQTANTILSGPTAAPSANPTFRVLVAADIPSLDASKITTGQLALARGGTHADLSATGGANKFLKQSSAGADVTVGAIGAGDVPDAALTSNVALLNRASQTFTGDPQIINGKLTVGSSSAPTVPLDVLAITAYRGVNVAARQRAAFPALILENTSTNGSVVFTENSGLAIYFRGTDLTTSFGASDLKVFIDQTGKFTTYNAIATAGEGVAPIYASGSFTGQTGTKANTTIYTAATTGTFRIGCYLVTSTVGTGGTVAATAAWTDDFAARTFTDATTVALNSVAATNWRGNSFEIRAATGTAIQIGAVVAAGAGAFQYALYYTLEQLS